jgi:hypothetical protein
MTSHSKDVDKRLRQLQALCDLLREQRARERHGSTEPG